MLISPIDQISQANLTQRVNFKGAKERTLNTVVPKQTIDNSQRIAQYKAAMAAKLSSGAAYTVIKYNENDSNFEQLEARKKAYEKKMEVLAKEWRKAPVTKFGSCNQPGELLGVLYKPVYTTDRFLNDGYGRHVKYSELCPQSMELLEKFIDNPVLNENEALRAGLMDRTIENFVEVCDIYHGMKFKDDINERAEKINMIMDAYIGNEEAQRSPIMKDTIGYIIYDAANAPIDIVKKAVNIISDSNLCNDKTVVDKMLEEMDSIPAIVTSYAKDENLKERLEHARTEMNKIAEYRFRKRDFNVKMSYEKYEINSINLPIVEKFLNNKEFYQNKEWLDWISYLIDEINASAFLMRGVKNTTQKVENAVKLMDKYLNDKDAQNSKDETEKYIKLVNDTLSWVIVDPLTGIVTYQ